MIQLYSFLLHKCKVCIQCNSDAKPTIQRLSFEWKKNRSTEALISTPPRCARSITCEYIKRSIRTDELHSICFFFVLEWFTNHHEGVQKHSLDRWLSFKMPSVFVSHFVCCEKCISRYSFAINWPSIWIQCEIHINSTAFSVSHLLCISIPRSNDS